MAELSASHIYDWQFHQATGLVAAELGTWDMGKAASRLIAFALIHGLSVHQAAVLVIDHQVQIR